MIVSGSLAAIGADASAQTVQELKAQIEATQKRLNELEQKQRVADDARRRGGTGAGTAGGSGLAVTGGAFPGSFKLPGSETSVRIGGYVKLDAIFNSRSAGVNSAADLALTPNAIAVGPGAGDNERGQFKMHARQSRLNVRTHTPSEWGDVTTFIEADFFGTDGNETSSNSHGMRLRHAWGTLGKLGAGQFWTNFMHLAALPETLDFGGPVGNIFIRQAQVRWTEKFQGGEWAVSLENAESIFGLPGTAATFRADDDRHPDIVASLSMNAGRAKYWVGALVRNIRIDSGAAPAASDDKWGGSLALSGVIPVGNQDDIRFFVYGGNSIGRYQPLGFFTDGMVDSAGNVSLPKIVGGFVAYRHVWGGSLRSTLALSAARADNPSGTFGGLNRRDHSAHVNLIWSATKAVDLGVEYIHARRELENDLSGTLNRVQFSAQYSF